MKVKYIGIVVGIVLAAMLFVGAGAASTADTFSIPTEKINTYDMENALAAKAMDNIVTAREEVKAYSHDRIKNSLEEVLKGLDSNPVAFLVSAIGEIQNLGIDYFRKNGVFVIIDGLKFPF